MQPTRTAYLVPAVMFACLAMQPAPGVAQQTGAELYRQACAACHGADGTGVSAVQLGFDLPVPDFTDCRFAPREPDSDWFAVTHDGGPARGFDRMMPAFGDALTDDQIQSTLDYIRTLCTDDSWPRGELNLPRAMFTEKAFPEDEYVWTFGVATDGPGAVSNEFIYEKRYGARTQVELIVPIESVRMGGDWHSGSGDIGIGVKRVLFDSFDSGSILSIAGEIIAPTGDEDRGIGAGVVRFEPFLAFGQAFPSDVFLHVQAGAEIPTNRNRVEAEGFWRGALGRTFTQGRFGRASSPMVEVLGARELTSGAVTNWDIVPQLHVTLNRRQHVMANVAYRVPLTDRDVRHGQFLVFLLLDWFDGGIHEGW